MSTDDAAPVAVILCPGKAGHAERVPWVTYPTWTAPTDGQCTVRPETSVTVHGKTWSAGWHSCDNCGHEGHFWSNRWSYGGGKVTEEQCPVCRRAYVPDNPDEAVVDAAQGHEIGEKDVENVTEQQAGISAREAVGQMRVALGLPVETSHADVLAEVRRLSGALVRISNALGIGPDSGVLEIVTRARSLVSEPVTLEEVERRRATRQEALHTVMDLWAQHRLGEDPPMDDLVLAAEWLSSGDLSTVLQIRKLYATGQPGVGGGVTDAATWTPHG